MKVTTRELRQAIERVLTHLETTGQTKFEVEHDFYWHVPETQRYDHYTEPSELTVGQLSDDIEQLKALASGNREPLGSDLVFTASVLRAIGELTKG